MIGHRSERFCVFLPIFAGRDGEGNEQKLGEEWGQAKQWKFVLKNPSVNGRSHLVEINKRPELSKRLDKPLDQK